MNVPAALPLQQHPRFAAALRLLGRDTRCLDVAYAHPVIAVRVLGQLFASRGPVWRDAPGQSARISALAQSRLRFLNAETDDCAALGAVGFRKIATAASVAELDLSASPAVRLAALHGKWRNQWRRAQEAPVTCQQERFDRARHQWLLDADTEQQKQKRFRNLPHHLIDALAAQDPRSVTVHVAYRAAEPVAAMLFILHRPVVTYHLGWVSRESRQWGLHHRLLIDAGNLFAERGYQRLDLGAVDTENAKRLARFKIASGARIRPLGGTWLRMGRLRG